MCAALSVSADEGKATGDVLQMPSEEISDTLRATPMPELGEGNLARIIKRYYVDGLGGVKNWDAISSLKISGTLKLEAGEYELNAYQKKPDLIKITMSAEGRELVISYDGKYAWQKLPGRGEQPKPMSEDEARRFKHSACFGSHLLYPFAAGKKLEFIDTVPIDGNICHQIRVTLNSDYQVDYFIDIRTYLQVKEVNTDLRTGKVNSVIYRDYSRELAMPIAMQVESYEEGKWVSTLTIDEVKINSGVIPWMFNMPR
jgi:hypothetical protein